MTTPIAQLLTRVNGAAAVAGAVTVPSAATIQFAFGPLASTWRNYRIEMYGPPGWTPPVGWTTEDGELSVYTSATATPPPQFTLPANTVHWGKWMCRLIVNEGYVDGVPTSSLVDETVVLNMLSPNGVEDVGTGERDWARPLQRALRALGEGGAATMKTIVEIDFTALPTSATFANDSTVTIADRAWKYREQNTMATKRVTNGAGVQLGGGNAQGCVWTPLLTLAPDLDFERPFQLDAHVIRSGTILTNANFHIALTDNTMNTASVSAGTWNTTGPGWIAYNGYRQSGTVHRFGVWSASETLVHSKATFITDNVYSFRWNDSTLTALSGLWADGWPSLNALRLRGHAWGGPVLAGDYVPWANIAFLFGYGYDVDSMWTLAHLRIRQ